MLATTPRGQAPTRRPEALPTPWVRTFQPTLSITLLHDDGRVTARAPLYKRCSGKISLL